MSATHVSASLRRLVRERAGECCEYCLIPEASMSHRLIEPVETVVAASRLPMLESIHSGARSWNLSKTSFRGFRMLTYKAMFKFVQDGVHAEILDFPGVITFGPS